VHIAIFVSRWYNEDDIDVTEDYINDLGTKDDFEDDRDVTDYDLACFSIRVSMLFYLRPVLSVQTVLILFSIRILRVTLNYP